MDASVQLSTLSKMEIVEAISPDIKRIATKFICNVNYRSSYDDMVSEGYYAAAVFLNSYYDDPESTLQSLRSYIYKSVSNVCYRNLHFNYRDVSRNYVDITDPSVVSAIAVSYTEQQASLNEWYRTLSDKDIEVLQALISSTTIIEASTKLNAYRDRISKMSKVYISSLKDTLIQPEVY